MKQTEHDGLSQWEKTDRILREDFNSDNAKVDAALAVAKTERDALATAVAGCGNCRIVTGSYTGSGLYGADNPNTLSFSGYPLAVFLNNSVFLIQGTASYSADLEYPNATSTVSWSGNSVSWYNSVSAKWQFSSEGGTYRYVALLAAD